jgi:hypothetical protein
VHPSIRNPAEAPNGTQPARLRIIASRRSFAGLAARFRRTLPGKRAPKTGDPRDLAYIVALPMIAKRLI